MPTPPRKSAARGIRLPSMTSGNGLPLIIVGCRYFPRGSPEVLTTGRPVGATDGLTDCFVPEGNAQLGLLLEIWRVRANNLGACEIGISRLRAGTAQAVGRREATIETCCPGQEDQD